MKSSLSCNYSVLGKFFETFGGEHRAHRKMRWPVHHLSQFVLDHERARHYYAQPRPGAKDQKVLSASASATFGRRKLRVNPEIVDFSLHDDLIHLKRLQLIDSIGREGCGAI